MNKNEFLVKQELEKDGWKVLRNGAPDFVALKLDNDGNILEVRGIEVKYNNDKLTYEQQVYKKIFEWAKVPFEVKMIQKEDIIAEKYRNNT